MLNNFPFDLRVNIFIEATTNNDSIKLHTIGVIEFHQEDLASVYKT